MLDLTNSSQIRQTFKSPPVSFSFTAVTKYDRETFGADLHPFIESLINSSTAASTNFIDVDNSSMLVSSSNGHTKPALSKTLISVTTTALLMINKQYTNNLSS